MDAAFETLVPWRLGATSSTTGDSGMDGATVLVSDFSCYVYEEWNPGMDMTVTKNKATSRGCRRGRDLKDI